MLIGTAIAFVFTAFIAGGFLGGYLKPDQTSCTLKGCPCLIGTVEGGSLQFRPLASGERPCNDCQISEYAFFTGVVNLKKTCEATEKIRCRNGEEVGTRLEIDTESCKYSFSFLSK